MGPLNLKFLLFSLISTTALGNNLLTAKSLYGEKTILLEQARYVGKLGLEIGLPAIVNSAILFFDFFQVMRET